MSPKQAFSELIDQKWNDVYWEEYIGNQKTQTQVAQELGVTQACVNRNFRRLGLKCRLSGPKRVSKAKAKELYDQYAAGATMQEVADRRGVSRQAISLLFQHHGWPARPRGAPVRPRCSVDGCDKIAREEGLCRMHLRRKRAHGELDRLPHLRLTKPVKAAIVADRKAGMTMNELAQKYGMSPWGSTFQAALREGGCIPCTREMDGRSRRKREREAAASSG